MDWLERGPDITALPLEWSLWREAPHEMALAGFEGIETASSRILNWVNDNRESNGTIVAFTHEAITRLSVAMLERNDISSIETVKSRTGHYFI